MRILYIQHTITPMTRDNISTLNTNTWAITGIIDGISVASTESTIAKCSGIWTKTAATLEIHEILTFADLSKCTHDFLRSLRITKDTINKLHSWTSLVMRDVPIFPYENDGNMDNEKFRLAYPFNTKDCPAREGVLTTSRTVRESMAILTAEITGDLRTNHTFTLPARIIPDYRERETAQ